MDPKSIGLILTSWTTADMHTRFHSKPKLETTPSAPALPFLLPPHQLQVVPSGLEPETLWLLAIRSDQLSYETSCWHLQLLLGQGFRLPSLVHGYFTVSLKSSWPHPCGSDAAFAKQFHACSKMPTLGFEPRLLRPQRDILTTRRCGPCFSSLNPRFRTSLLQ